MESDRARVHSKAARQAQIASLLLKRAVTSQSDLAALLASEGIATTQATLSRDLLEMRAQKVRNSNGTLVYALPPDGVIGEIVGVHAAPDLAQVEARFAQLAHDLVVSAERAGNLIVLHTPAGAAQYLAAALDRSLSDGILGTVAGDDTVLVVCRGVGDAEALILTIHGITSNLGGGRPAP